MFLNVHDGDVLPVFPLPNIILFPHLKVPLHIFEPKYKQMVVEALSKDRMIAISLLKKGWEWEPIPHEICCAGQIVKAEDLPNGEKNIAVHGIARVMTLAVRQHEPYLKAEIHLLQESAAKKEEVEMLRRQLASLMNQYIFLKPDIPDTLIQITNMIYDPGYLADFFAYYFFPNLYEKQRILENLDIADRCRQVILSIETSLKEIQGYAA